MKMNSKNIFKMLFRVLPYVYRGAPFNLIYMSVIALIYSVLWFAIVPANNYMFDTVLGAVNGNATMAKAIASIIVVLCVLIIHHIFNGLNAYNNMYQYHTVTGYLNDLINEKIDQMSAIDFENPIKLEEIEKAKKGYEYAMWLVNIFVGLIFFYIPELLFYVIYFFKINKLLVFIVFLIFIPQIISSILQSRYHIDLENELSPIRRKLINYDNCLTGSQFIKETRMLGAYSYFAKHYKDAHVLLNKKKFMIEEKVAFIRFLLTLLTLTGYVGVLYLLLKTMISGSISIGAFSAIFISLSSLTGMVKEIAFGTFSNLSENFGSVLNFVNFIEKEPVGRMDETDIDYSNGIYIHNISFQYPNTNKKAIDDINLEIHKGETLAIVGENGAGKSTLARLMLGIYQPLEGDIKIGNIVNKKGNAYISHKNTSAIFQNFQRFSMTLQENVSISDLSNYDDISEYIKKVGIKLDSELFTDGQQTMLSREYGGIDLSGGQWQRIAIARGLYRKHDLIIMDEPTSAIDPIEESKIFELFGKISKDKIAVIITHRLGSVKLADRIIVLDEGKIVEEGTHESLMAQNGKYSFMFYEQAKWYERE